MDGPDAITSAAHTLLNSIGNGPDGFLLTSSIFSSFLAFFVYNVEVVFHRSLATTTPDTSPVSPPVPTPYVRLVV